MDEGDRAVGAGPRLAVDELGLRHRERLERGRQVIGHEADVVDALAVRGQVAGDTAVAVDRLDELEAGRRSGPVGRKQRRTRCGSNVISGASG